MTTKPDGSRNAVEFLEGLIGRPMTFGDYLRHVMDRDGVSLKRMASRLCVSPWIVEEWHHHSKSTIDLCSVIAGEWPRELGLPESSIFQLVLQHNLHVTGLRYKVKLEAY